MEKGDIEGFEVVMISNGVTRWNKGAIIIMSIVVENFVMKWKVGNLHKKGTIRIVNCTRNTIMDTCFSNKTSRQYDMSTWPYTLELSIQTFNKIKHNTIKICNSMAHKSSCTYYE